MTIEYEILGRSPDEIIRSHPPVSLYQIRARGGRYFTHDTDFL